MSRRGYAEAVSRTEELPHPCACAPLPVLHERGPLTRHLQDYLDGLGPTLEPVEVHEAGHAGADDPEAVLADDDLQLALYRCYELHYRGFAGEHVLHEWDPRLLAWRAALEQRFERALLQLVPPRDDVRDASDAVGALTALTSGDDGPSLSRHLLESGDLRELREVLVHRSAYQLKEADPHSWALPRLDGEAKAAFVAIQMDEYGNGTPGASHAELFATTMVALGLDPTYGAYLDRLPGSTLATVNLVTLLGLHHRLLPALVGHLAAFEMTSTVPMSRYSGALARHGFGEPARRFYDVHVLADAAHAELARVSLVEPFVRRNAHAAGMVVWGAEALLEVERRFSGHVLGAWAAGTSSLLPPCLVRSRAPRPRAA